MLPPCTPQCGVVYVIVRSSADAILESLGKQPGSIPRSEVQRFCKHCREMRVVRTPPLADELAQKGGEGMRNMLASEVRARRGHAQHASV